MKNLRKRYLKFIYEDYSWKISRKGLEIFFDFKVLPDISFKHKIIVKNVKKSQVKRVGDRVLNNLIFHLGLVEIPSYWKATCSPIIVIRPGFLNKGQINFWKNLIVKGMGQFFYENKINFTKPNFLTINSVERQNFKKLNVTMLVETSSHLAPRLASQGSVKDPVTLKNDRFLVPVGGGKDSVITLESLKKKRAKVGCFLVNPAKAAQSIVKIARVKEKVVVERKIDKKLLELNKKGVLNGHIPISAVLSFLSVLVGVLFDYKNIAFSNEKSADEGNLRYLGRIINHQWSKSSEFERKFRQYTKKYLAKDVNYFSFLRKYTELEIARIFTKYPKYFYVFSSCNTGQKRGERWCGNCPKCLFVYASLYPYLEKKIILKIFGRGGSRSSAIRRRRINIAERAELSLPPRDIFENRKLLLTLKALIGQGSHKPFECVGTFSESREIFKLCLKRAEKFGKAPYLLARFKKT